MNEWNSDRSKENYGSDKTPDENFSNVPEEYDGFINGLLVDNYSKGILFIKNKNKGCFSLKESK